MRSQRLESGFDQVPPIYFDAEDASRPHLDAELEKMRDEAERLRSELREAWRRHDARMRSAEAQIERARDWAYDIVTHAVRNRGGIL